MAECIHRHLACASPSSSSAGLCFHRTHTGSCSAICTAREGKAAMACVEGIAARMTRPWQLAAQVATGTVQVEGRRTCRGVGALSDRGFGRPRPTWVVSKVLRMGLGLRSGSGAGEGRAGDRRHPGGVPEAVASPEAPAPGLQQASQQVMESLFLPLPGHSVSHLPSEKSYKVTVVGVGNVGMACAQTILTQDLADELALVDVLADKLRGEMLDLQHAAAFLPRATIKADTDYAVTAGSDICIVTAGARQRDGETRLSLVERNVSLFKNIIPKLVEHSPNTTLLIVSNPVDILTYVSWKLSGLPPNRVIGSGTNLDSSRFKFVIASQLDVNAQNVHAYIVGEHGDSCVALWSSVSVGGVPVLEFLRKRGVKVDKEDLKAIRQVVVDGAYQVIKLKGYTSWAIGYSVASLTKSLLRNQRRIHPVSVLAKGFHGIEDEVFLSLPAQLGRAGILSVVNTILDDEESDQIRRSAKALWEVQSKLDI